MSAVSGVPVEPPAGAVRDAVERALAEDLGPLGDVTAALVPVEATAAVDVVAREPGVLAGTACATEVYRRLDPAVVVAWSGPDGSLLDSGTLVGTISGPLRPILTGERSALNFLCHLSGVATVTRAFVERAGGHARILDTRKTLPGLRALEKAAVRAGGGANHRGNLSELVLVKDNHLGGVTIAEAVRRAREAWPGRGVEVECDRPAQMEEAIAAGATMVLLDNMTPEQVGACVERARATAPPGFLVEVSGGVTLATVAAYADAGADLISSGSITQSAPALDIGFDLR